jgi:hypothetical protein
MHILIWPEHDMARGAMGRAWAGTSLGCHSNPLGGSTRTGNSCPVRYDPLRAQPTSARPRKYPVAYRGAPTTLPRRGALCDKNSSIAID